MKNFIIKMFEEQGGDVSLTRVITLLALIMGFTIAILGIYKGADLNALSILVSSFITPALAAKTISKFAEREDK